MSFVLISGLLKPRLFFDCVGFCVTGHFKRLFAPYSNLNVKVLLDCTPVKIRSLYLLLFLKNETTKNRFFSQIVRSSNDCHFCNSPKAVYLIEGSRPACPYTESSNSDGLDKIINTSQQYVLLYLLIVHFLFLYIKL